MQQPNSKQSTPTKTALSNARAKMIQVRTRVEADRKKVLAPVIQGFRQTAKLEITRVADFLKDVSTKIAEEEISESE